MTRLVVEEGGERRAFKVGEGRLTIGSGAAAKLRLQSTDVASIHAELEVRAGVATLHVRPGVVPVKVGGLATSDSMRLAPGVPVMIGSATLRIESDPSKAATGAVPWPVPVQPGVTRPARVQPGVTSARATPRKVKHGIPTWMIVAPVSATLAILFAFVMRGVLSKGDEPTLNESLIYYNKAKSAFAHNQLAAAELELSRIPVADVSPDLRGAVEQLQKEVDAAQDRGDLALHNMEGTKYLEQQLKRFDRQHLKGEAGRPKVRVFLKRIEEFKRRWPEHEEMPWVERQERRFAGLVNLADPPDFEDIAFEVESLTWAADMRNYKECFALLDRFLEDCSGEDREKTLALIDEQRTQRAEWFEERRQRARFEFDDGQPGRSAAWLVALIRYSGDTAMEDKAATDLVRFEGIEARLRGYRDQKPDVWAELLANSVIREFALQQGLAAK
jgi:hypothetical protein